MSKKSTNLCIRIEPEVLELIEKQANARGISKTEFVSACVLSERPMYEDFRGCLRVLHWMQEQGFLALKDVPLIIRYVEQCTKRYSALPMTSTKPLDIPRYKD